VGEWVSARFEASGLAVERITQAVAGDDWLITGSGDGGTLRCITSTRHAVGTVETPWRPREARHGPGA
jgi:hypothetical protein